MAFIRRKGNSYYLVHNVRKQGKVQQLHLARLGERPRITDDVVRKVSRNHPFLELDWSDLREQVNSRVELFDIRSFYVQNLMHSLRNRQFEPGSGHAITIASVDARRQAGPIRAQRTGQSGKRKEVPVRSHHGGARATTRSFTAQRGIERF